MGEGRLVQVTRVNPVSKRHLARRFLIRGSLQGRREVLGCGRGFTQRGGTCARRSGLEPAEGLKTFLGLEPDAQHLDEQFNPPAVLPQAAHLVPDAEELVRHGVEGRMSLAPAQHHQDLSLLQAAQLFGDGVQLQPGRSDQVRRLRGAAPLHQGVDNLALLGRQAFHLVLQERGQLVHQPTQLLDHAGNLLLAEHFVQHQDEPWIAAREVDDGTDLRLVLAKLAEESFVAVVFRPQGEQFEHLFRAQAVQPHFAEVVEECLVVTPERFKDVDRAANDHHAGVRHQQPAESAFLLIGEAFLEEQVEVLNEKDQPSFERLCDLAQAGDGQLLALFVVRLGFHLVEQKPGGRDILV